MKLAILIYIAKLFKTIAVKLIFFFQRKRASWFFNIELKEER